MEAVPRQQGRPLLQAARSDERRSGLCKVFPTDDATNTTIDIIAIHGLGTESPRTWVFKRKDGREVNWLEDGDMLPAAVPEARIFTYNWNANYFRDAPVQTLLGHADALLALVNESRSFEKRPIIFVASCFGGLVLAEALTRADQGSSPYRQVLLSTVGTVFLATPFHGTDAHKEAQWQVIVGGIMGEDTSDRLVQDLNRSHDFVLQRVWKFAEVAHADSIRLPVHCFYETKKTEILRRVLSSNWAARLSTRFTHKILVNESSACLHGFGRHGLEATHSGMNKFDSPENSSFKLVKYVIQEFANNAASVLDRRSHNQPGRWTVPFGRNESFIGRESMRSQLLERSPSSANEDDCQRTAIEGRHVRFVRRGSLLGRPEAVLFPAGAPLDFGDNSVQENPQPLLTKTQIDCLQVFRLTDYEWYKDHVEERVDGTCEWFLEQPNFQTWLQADFGPLLVSADPGCGKSVLARFLVDTGLPRTVTICYFFFKDQDQNTVKQALCALLHQLFSHKPSLIRHAIAEFVKNGDKLINISSALWSVLESATSDPEAGQIVCVLDAIDECAEAQLKILIQRLRGIFCSKAERRGKLRFLLTSRPYENIVSPFQGLEEIYPHIRIPGEEYSQAISLEVNVVIRHQIDRLTKEKKLSLPLKRHLETRLLESQHRTYLWVHLVFNCLRSFRFERTEDSINSILDNLQTVEEAYENILSKSKDRIWARKALCIVLAAKKPLALKQMNTAFKFTSVSDSIKDVHLENDKDFKDTLRERCGLLLCVYEERIHFLHQTARRFLIRDLSGLSDSPSYWKHSISMTHAHAILAESCIRYLCFVAADMPGEMATPGRIQECRNRYVFLDYSANYWAYHFHESKSEVLLVKQTLNATTLNANQNLLGKLNRLSTEFGNTYQQTWIVDILCIAIDMEELAIELTPEEHPDRAAYSNNLGRWLGRRYERTGEMADLEEAIKTARQAVNSTPDDHPDHTGYLDNLGRWLGRRYERTGEMADLEEAIKTARQAIDSTPDDHPDRTGYLNNLGRWLGRRYERTGEMADLEEAIKMARQAVNSTPGDHPDRAGRLNNLGNMLGNRYKRTGEMADLDNASFSLHNAWSCATAVPFHRVEAAARCLKLLAKQQKFNLAAQLAKEVIDLLPSVHTNLLDRKDQQFAISTFAGVAADLCSFLLELGQPEAALGYLEQGRAIIIGQLMDRRSDLSGLSREHPNIARRYENLVNEVNTPLRSTKHDAAETQARKRRPELMNELNATIKEIRNIAGYERFLLGQTVAEMQETAADGNIVVVNITDFRSDVIIVSGATVKAFRLPGLLPSEAKAWLGKKWTGKRSELRKKNNDFLKYLSWLWKSCVQQILDEIDSMRAPPDQGLTRVWWIGTGLASSMPLHAAGIHTSSSMENAYNRVVSSYTPSIKALARARSRAENGAEKGAENVEDTNGSLLLATMSTTPKARDAKKAPSPLKGVKEERDQVVHAANGRLPTTVLSQPSVEQVAKGLQDCSIAHFACHGYTDGSDPSNSGLILQKGGSSGEDAEQDRLTVHRISELDLARAQIAYLSACSTAENRAGRLSDEVIHVVSGFQVAGFPHVVGCLWPSVDWACVKAADGFYSKLLGKGVRWSGGEVAAAVRDAVMGLRAAEMSMPLTWAQFVHYGV